jgi:hypothetical protein
VIVDLDTEIGTRQTDELIEMLDRGEGHELDTLNEIRRRGRTGIEEILAIFPGRLRFDRASTRELPVVSDCSTVLRVLMAIGRPVISSLAPLLVHGDDDVRFYATYLLSELTFPESVVLLARRLSDSDPAVRRAAAYGLRRCRELPQFSEIMQDLRDDLTHPDARPRMAAMEALGALGDAVAAPSLIAQLKDSRNEVIESARRALVFLTRQDLGNEAAEWRKWWEKNRSRHRIEWLIDGLVHESREIRDGCAVELRELTGLAFGYDPDLPPEKREQCRTRFATWWGESGLYDFGRY